VSQGIFGNIEPKMRENEILESQEVENKDNTNNPIISDSNKKQVKNKEEENNNITDSNQNFQQDDNNNNLYQEEEHIEKKQKRPEGNRAIEAERSQAKKPKSTKPKWVGQGIILHRSAFGAMGKVMGKEEGKHIRFKPIRKRMLPVMRGGKAERIRVPKGYGILQIDENFGYKERSFLWQVLKQTVETKERVFVGAPLEGMMTVERHIREGDKIKSTTKPDVLRFPAQTFPSRELQEKAYGGLIPEGNEMSLTSPYDDLSLIFLCPIRAGNVTVAHEILGHFYLASTGRPSGHPESLKGKKVLNRTGKEFEGTVLEFIETQIEREAKENLKKN